MDNKTKGKSPMALELFMLFLPALFLLVGGGFIYASYTYFDHATHVTGIVVETNRYSDGITTFQPVIGFMDSQGQRHFATTLWRSSRYDFPVGERVDIYYDRRDPTKIRLDSWFSLWGFGTIFLAFGGFFAGLLLFVFSSFGKRKKKRALK